jgi:hypothetical protein
MKTLTDLLELGENFIDAFDEANDRFKEWNTNQYDYLLENLEMLNNTLSINKFFDKNLYIDSDNLNKSHIRLRSGKTMIPNSQDDESFEVNFLQISNGKIYCYFILNSSSGNNAKNIQIEVIDNPDDLEKEKIIDIVYKGLEYYKKYSYLFN